MYFLKFLEAGKFEIKVRQGQLLVKCRLVWLLTVSSRGRERGTWLLPGVSNPTVAPWGPPSLPNYLPKASPAHTITWWGKRQAKFQHMNLGWRTVGFPGGSGGKESAYRSGDLCSISRSGRSSGGGSGYPLQYSCLENPMVRGAWWATVHRVTKSHTTERLTHTQAPLSIFNAVFHPTFKHETFELFSQNTREVRRFLVKRSTRVSANPGRSSTAHVGLPALPLRSSALYFWCWA